VWVEHTLASGASWHPFAAPLQQLSCITAALLLAALLQVRQPREEGPALLAGVVSVLAGPAGAAIT
jgi:hypothetical protein